MHAVLFAQGVISRKVRFKGYVGQMCDDMTKKPLQISSWGGDDLIIHFYESAMIRIFVQNCLKSSKIAMKKSSETPIDV